MIFRERMPLLHKENPQEKKCCNFRMIDKSEPLIIVGGLLSTAGLIYSATVGQDFWTVSYAILAVSSGVAEWRVRALGVAKHLMDSIDDMQEENMKLKEQVTTLGSEVEKFEGIVGVLGDNIEDIESAKNQLFELYTKYKEENEKQQANNLLTLFGIVDKNNDSRLDADEMARMRDYISIVYKEEYDFDLLDKDNDGSVSLKEFIEKFRDGSSRKKKKKTQHPSHEPSTTHPLEQII